MRRLLPAVVLLASACARTPEADYRAGRFQEAADGFRRRIEVGDTSAVAGYNLGTARVRLGEHGAARAGLEGAAARARSAELRFRAEFNAGLSDLEPALAAGGRDSATVAQLTRAVRRYRAALRLRPGDRDAKWNLELAERALRQPPPQESESGGGNEEQPQPSGGGSRRDPSESSAGPGDPGLTPGEADRILSAADREERRVQHRRMRSAPESQRAVRDW